jgi:4-amino-4-deoxy-L-arabinose transferase-like glycosyltransferase
MWKRWSSGLRAYRWEAAALLAGLLLRAWFVLHHAQFGGDTLVYGDLAHNLRLHHIFGFTDDHGIRPTLIRLPGYPFFVAACFALFGEGNYVAILWVQVVLDLLTCWLLSRLATRLFGPRAGAATLWLAALCPFTGNYAAVPITECLTLFCITVAFYSFERWIDQRGVKRWPLILGFALAFAVLLRPDRGLLAAAILPAMLWVATRKAFTARSLLPVATATFILLLPLALWGARNYRVFHTFQPLAPRYANDPGEAVPLGFQRWYRTWAIDFQSTVDIYWAYDGSTLSLDALPARAFDSPQQRAATQALFDTYNLNTSASPALDAGFSSLASARIAAHPVRFYLLLPAARVLDMFLRPRTELMRLPIDWWHFHRHPGASAFALAYALLNAAYLALALIGLYRWSAHNFRPIPPLAAAMLAFVALRILLLLTLDNSEPRYTLDCFPVILLLAGMRGTLPANVA